VSVVIPCYQQARFLGDAIRSVRAQTYKNWEIVVAVADEESARTALRFSKDNLTIIHDGGRGLANARNEAIRAAKGPYILPLDADDMLAPNFLAKTVPLVTATTVVGTWLQMFGARSGVLAPPMGERALWLTHNPLFVCSLYSKALWECAGGYPVAPFGYEDWGFWLSCAAQGASLAVVAEPLFRYRTHEAQDSAFCLEHNDVLRAMVRLLHPDLASDSAQNDLAVVRAMPEVVRERMKRRQTWFPDNETIRVWLGEG